MFGNIASTGRLLVPRHLIEYLIPFFADTPPFGFCTTLHLSPHAVYFCLSPFSSLALGPHLSLSVTQFHWPSSSLLWHLGLGLCPPVTPWCQFSFLFGGPLLMRVSGVMWLLMTHSFDYHNPLLQRTPCLTVGLSLHLRTLTQNFLVLLPNVFYFSLCHLLAFSILL